MKSSWHKLLFHAFLLNSNSIDFTEYFPIETVWKKQIAITTTPHSISSHFPHFKLVSIDGVICSITVFTWNPFRDNVSHLCLKGWKFSLFNSLQKIQTLSLSLKMFKLIATILFAHVLLAAPLPQYQVKRAFPNDCGLFTPQKCHGYLTQNHHVDHHEAPVEDDFLSTAGTSHWKLISFFFVIQ